MYCPNCGKTNSVEQKFCRSCGLSLEKAVESLIEQLPATIQNQELKERQRKVDKWMTIVGGGAVSIVVVSVIFGIIYKIIIVKGDVIAGSIFLAVIVGLIVFAMLAIYSTSLSKAAGKQAGKVPTFPKTEDTAKSLPEPIVEPLPSVTERTTELLMTEKLRDDDFK